MRDDARVVRVVAQRGTGDGPVHAGRGLGSELGRDRTLGPCDSPELPPRPPPAPAPKAQSPRPSPCIAADCQRPCTALGRAHPTRSRARSGPPGLGQPCMRRSQSQGAETRCDLRHDRARLVRHAPYATVCIILPRSAPSAPSVRPQHVPSHGPPGAPLFIAGGHVLGRLGRLGQWPCAKSSPARSRGMPCEAKLHETQSACSHRY